MADEDDDKSKFDFGAPTDAERAAGIWPEQPWWSRWRLGRWMDDRFYDFECVKRRRVLAFWEWRAQRRRAAYARRHK